ncbi:MAG: MarR family transcriptional regulator [Acidimicrobiales bacterium]|nr:MarR family transcriptional regulator [Acidimicrobiales bacterium]HRW37168.1 MarR family transcriptional regulator [Aquihabitans sp.]
MQSSSERLADAMLHASRALVASAARSLGAVSDEVTLPQYRMLVVLATRGAQSGTQLAEELETAPSSVTRMCDRLEAKGLIARDQGPDRRTLEIAITTEGDELVGSVADDRRRRLAALVAAVPADQRDVLADALDAVARAGGELPGPAPDWAVGWDR